MQTPIGDLTGAPRVPPAAGRAVRVDFFHYISDLNRRITVLNRIKRISVPHIKHGRLSGFHLPTPQRQMKKDFISLRPLRLERAQRVGGEIFKVNDNGLLL
jgi:hypothetical protein